jgi:hypothetical protein
MTSCVVSASTPMFLPATPMCPPARHSTNRSHHRAYAWFPPTGPVAVAVYGVSSESEADLTPEGDRSGRHHRPDDAPDVEAGAGLCRRQGAEVADGRSGVAATVPAGPAAPMPSKRCVAQQADPAVDTPALTRASGADQRQQSQQPPLALVRSPVHARNSEHQRGC